ncbi:MAG: hypothetical protein H6719_25190 [Sandaracinaceae bacterium]|nr:hypothetical protein [Myxococcales bacterium]MCB9596041.1 hypothetical protein [Sandaracinaceae bacterium]
MKGFIGLVVLAATVSSGCALNGVLEVEMQLPYTDGAAPRARIQVCAVADCEADIDTHGHAEVIEIGPGATPCASGGDCNARFSVVSDQTDLDRLQVRVRFCVDDCEYDLGRPDAPELWFELEEPFERGRRTYWNPSEPPYVRIPDAQPAGRPSAPTVIPKCEIADECWSLGNTPDPMFGYCDAAMRRFCEE